MKRMIAAGLLALAACAQVPAPEPETDAAPACTVSAADQAWIDRALAAWQLSAHEMTGIGDVAGFEAVFFDAGCTLTSADAFSSGRASDAVWRAAAHDGMVALPDGDAMPAGITSFTSGTGEHTFFVMSTPSVWRGGGVEGGPLGLETLMVAVLLHEGSHVAQAGTYGERIGALADRENLPDEFSDDTMQATFESDPDFAASIARETELFFAAAAAPDRDAARALADEARQMMKARAAKYFTGDDAYWTEAEDLWLTLEGSGQWAGHAWLVDPRGAAVGEDAAMPGFGQRSRWWSQKEGLALVLTLDRLSPGGWKAHVYGDGTQTLLDLLDAALAAG
jgi:hypothetical protein